MMLQNNSNRTWIEIRADDGSLIKIRTSEINLVQLPASRLALANPNQTPTALVIIGNTPMNFPVEIGEVIEKMLDEADQAKARNISDLTGNGVARN